MAYVKHKTYNDNNNALMTSNNHCSTVVTVAFVLAYATGSRL